MLTNYCKCGAEKNKKELVCNACKKSGKNSNSNTEREQNRSFRNRCSHCGTPTNSQGKCYTSSCVNYVSESSSNPPNKIPRGFCQQCHKNNVLLADGSLCFKCFLTNIRLELQELIKESGLKSAQIA
jgi:hypothetical protein